MTASLQVDMSRLVLELRMVDKKFAASIRREIRAACTELGDEVLVKIRAASAWSTGAKHGTSIGEATTLRPNFSVRSAGVRIVTSRTKAPHAGLFELGNKGSKDDGPGTFTNGKKGTVEKRPFFYSSARAIDPDVEARLLLAVDVITREAGFR